MKHVFLEYFGLPDGGIWSNVLAEPVCVALASVAAVLLRHKIGKALAGWWHHHRAPHMEKLIDERLALMKDDLLDAIKAHLDHRDS